MSWEQRNADFCNVFLRVGQEEGERMSITDELREWARGFENVWFKPASKEIVVTTGTSMPVDHVNMRLFIEGMLDRIDAEHERTVGFCKRLEDAAAKREDVEIFGVEYTALPLDADGEPIRVGDVVTMQLLFGGESKPLVVDRMELSHGRDGDLWCVALDTDKECWNQPSLIRHHHEPTVEDVLREFAYGLGVPVADSYVAAAATKLRLAGDE